MKSYWKKGRKQKLIIVFGSVLLLLLLFFLRDDYQPILLFIRKYIFLILLGGIFLAFAFRAFRHSETFFKRIAYLALIAGVFFAGWNVGWKLELYEYMQTYNVYNNLDKVEIDELPLTTNERIQPYNNILTMAYESISETQEVSLPQLVRVDSENKWTMAVQPAQEYTWQRVNDNTEEVFSVESTSPFPRFSNENRIPVTFSIGESLAFSRNTYNAVVQRFNIFQLFNLEPSEVFYMKNDTGAWVQVVSLIKWKGFFFPYPTFGGVMIIDSGEHNFNDYVERMTIGKGLYVSPDQMDNYPFLRKQNTLAEQISKLQAESLKFLAGFSDPLPWNMETAVKIPDLKDDENTQPYVTDFIFDDVDNTAFNGLYHWFGLEPIGEERTSLAFSVFVPADGTQKLYYYNHAAKKEGLAGVSAMPLKVIESKKEYDWDNNRPVEFRPYIKHIGERKRMFVLGTVTAKRKDSKKFDGSATPDLALVDVQYRDVIWIDAKHPSSWEKTIYNQMAEVWSTAEGLNLKTENSLEVKATDTITNTKAIKEALQAIARDSIN
ncbi:hypothetical protein [Croceibacter atlanticus]|uniref:hypothetical protein n=1 Tax=Croceibacter atlanticus TaxID=313588 RepID=UPI0032B1DFBB